MAATSAIAVRHIRKSFDSGLTWVLDDVSLEIAAGKITAIIGPSGSGKSVLLKHILGLLLPTSGEVAVLGQPLHAMLPSDLLSFRRRLGVLLQQVALFDDMTTLENVCFPLTEFRTDLNPDEIVQSGLQKLAMAGFSSDDIAKMPGELSSGMQKRVGLARALALNPEILLYDEPTTGLDPILTGIVDNLILETHRQRQGKTTVIITHDLAAAFAMADHIIMLDQGRVLLEGKEDDFRASDHPVILEFIEKGLSSRHVLQNT